MHNNGLNWILIVMALVYGCPSVLSAQFSDSTAIKGSPRIVHYTKKDFQSDPQFWSMTQDHQGLLYYGNNEGALIFDGETWAKVALPNNSSVRSLRVSVDGTVYAGGFNEFGTISRDEFGKFRYHSLVHLLRPEDRSFENVWQIHEVQSHVVFRAGKMLIIYSGGKAVSFPTGVYNFSSVVNNRLFVQDSEHLNILDLVTMEVRKLAPVSQFAGEDVLALLPADNPNEAYAVTKQGSFYIVDANNRSVRFISRVLPKGSSNLLTCGIRAANGTFFLGTLRSKVLALSSNLTNIGKAVAFDDVQDNTVLNLFESAEGNIWVMLNNGLDCLDLSSPLTLVYGNASVYDVRIYNKSLYVATNQGVLWSSRYSRDNVTNSAFAVVEGLEGQAWSLQQYGNHLVCSHDRGLFEIGDKGIRHVPGTSGVWKVIPVGGKQDTYLACTYNGILVLSLDSKKGFSVVKKIQGFDESSRDILQGDEPGIFWVCHGYKGVFRIKIDDDYSRVVTLEHFRDENGLPSPFNVNVTRWQDQIVFTTNAGIYHYNAQHNRFEPHVALNNLFGTEKNVRQLRQEKDRTWFVHDNEAGYFFSGQKTPELQKGHFLQLKGSFNPSMECIVPVDEKTVLFGTNNGLYSFDLNFVVSPRRVPTYISSVVYSTADTTVSGRLSSDVNTRIRVPYDATAIDFKFAAPRFHDKFNIEYSYWLEGAESGWSSWNSQASKDYSLLPPGKYIFHVRARSLLGETSEEAAYSFEIFPPWYQSKWAVLLYILLATATLVSGAFVTRRRVMRDNEKRLSEEKEKRQVLELELRQMKLQQEKEAIKKDKDLLEEDVIFKSKELANYTMLLVKKRDLLTMLHDELKELKESVKTEAVRQKIRDMIKRINLNLHDEEHIKVFEANFERVHQEFFSRLKAAFPDLTTKEQQLCAFVKMNLTNKEIASILNISVRGVETARYRLRKRLGLAQEEDMAHFLEKLYSPSSEESFHEHTS